jgi:hypothetical protein
MSEKSVKGDQILRTSALFSLNTNCETIFQVCMLQPWNGPPIITANDWSGFP